MTYLVTSLIVLWLGGLLFFAGQALNDMRLVLNNLVPGTRYSEFSSGLRIMVSKINPAKLTDIGQQHQRSAIRHERIMFAWTVAGLILIVCYFSCIRA
jgi:hypothetical protein